MLAHLTAGPSLLFSLWCLAACLIAGLTRARVAREARRAFEPAEPLPFPAEPSQPAPQAAD